VIALIQSLSIKNFRGIEEGAIEGLGPVNILVGKNNSGKSTVFDLLCFIRAPFNPRNELGEFVLESLLQRRVKRELSAEIEFFHNYLPEKTIEVDAKFDNNEHLLIRAGPVDSEIAYSILSPDNRQQVATLSMTSTNFPRVEITGAGGMPNQQRPLPVLLNRFRSAPMSSSASRYVRSELTEKNLEFVSRVVLIDADFVRKIEGVENAFWAEILKRRSDRKLKDTLNETYGLQIDHFSFAPYRGGRSKLFTELPEISMHIDDYGDGFRYAFSILTIASQLKDAALLLEEPEVHQHEGALLPLFEALFRLGSQNNVQIFISTHSLDVVRIWTEITSDTRIYHLKLQNGKLESRRIEGADAKLLIDLGVSPLRFEDQFPYVVIEGDEDRAFLDAVTRKLKQKSLKDLGYKVLQSPKHEQKMTVSALASTGSKIISCVDFDEKTDAKELIKPFIDTLTSRYSDVETADTKTTVKKTGSVVTFVPMGLPTDKELSDVGITHHAMEDYALKILSADKNVQQWAGISLKDLRNRAESFRDKAPLNSSKTLLMTLGVLKEGKTIKELLPELIDKTDPAVLVEILTPLITQLLG
jgi:hypothetical protein